MPKKTKLTDQQKTYVEARAKGVSRDQSALLAGYAKNTADPNVSRVESSPTVQQELARIRAETAKNSGVTKEDVVQMLMDAAQMAKMMADPTGLVGAARELGKMLGFYAPEVKKVTHGLDKNSLKQVLSEMTDEELQRIANARAIEGVAEEVKALPNHGGEAGTGPGPEPDQEAGTDVTGGEEGGPQEGRGEGDGDEEGEGT